MNGPLAMRWMSIGALLLCARCGDDQDVSPESPAMDAAMPRPPTPPHAATDEEPGKTVTCEWEGTRCEDDVTRLCRDRVLLSISACAPLHCRDETRCEPPESPLTRGESDAGEIDFDDDDGVSDE